MANLILIQYKIKLGNNVYRSISYLQTVKFSDLDDLIEIFTEFWNLRDEDYISLNPTNIVYTYKFIKSTSDILVDGSENTFRTKLNKHKSIKKKISSIKFKGFNLPCTMDFSQWGKITNITETSIIIKKLNSKFNYHISIFDDYFNVALKLKDKSILEFTDTIIEKGKLNSFVRKVKNQEYIFIDGNLIVKKIQKETKFINKIICSGFTSKLFLTMDLETRTIDGIMTPYCVSIYDGNKAISFYLKDFENANEMLKASLKYLMIPKYHDYKVYLHNFSNFDAIFLLRILSELTIIPIKPIIKDNNIIDLKFSFDLWNTKFTLFFRDSYLLLPSSLAKLAINFNVENKGIFPYSFVNDNKTPLDYIGSVPDYKYFSKISIEEYNSYKAAFSYFNKWSLRKETIKYCEQDCKTLYQIICSFQKKIFLLFRLDILKYPTLSSLAFAIFRSKFLKNAKIPIIDGDLFDQLKKAYSGGAVDVYKPFPKKGEKVYRYDVNSLYPSTMKDFNMPVGNPIYFEGDISLIGPNSGYNIMNKPFGFFEVEVEAPKNMKIPLLQTRLKMINGYKTVAPLGTWTDTYFSEEIFNAIKFGYKFKILRGYLFEEANIFSEYVDYLYKLKVNSPSKSPDYIISKLLLNTLYGRFGMSPHMESHLIITNEETLKVQNQRVVTNIIDLRNGKELISFFDDNEWNEEGEKKSLNISVSISAAVTAYARIHMTKFKTMEGVTLYYSDTDSIDIDQPLDPKYIGTELGKMKLEHIFDDAIFLAPKVYGGKTSTYEYVKVKGLKNPVSFNELKPLLIKSANLKINQEKWYRNINDGNIKILPQIYTLMINNQKRELVFDNSNKFVDTRPIILNNGYLK
jgi:hypothetical protein